MIHPINIPDDLLAANPTRPQFIEPKKMRPKIVYSKDGRKFNQDGNPLTPNTPGTLWNDFFLRSFVRRIACEHQADSAERCSIDTLIDVVDLQPSSSEQLDVNLNVVNPVSLASSMENLKLHDKLERKPTISKLTVPSLVTDRMDVQEDSEEEITADKKKVEEDPAILGSNACMPRTMSRQRSMKMKLETLKPLLTPCCSGFQQNDKSGGAPLKEFARFDFSHSNFFSNDLPNHPASQQNEEEDCCEEISRKRSLLLLPNAVGSRIWTPAIKQKTDDASSLNRLAPALSLPMEGMPPSTPKLLFRVLSVATCRNKKLYIALEVNNSVHKEFRFQIVEHVHEASGDKIDGILQNTKEKTVTLKPNENTKVEILLDITETIERLFQHPEKYLVMTLHGRIL